MRIAIVSTFPPGKGSLNEYALYFINALRGKAEVSEVILLADELPAGEKYQVDKDFPVPMQVIPCWRFGDLRNSLRIARAVTKVKPDLVIFNIQFASFGDGKLAASLGLLTPALLKLLRFPVIVLLHNIMETIDLSKAGFKVSPLMEKLIRLSGTIVTRCLLTADFVALTIPKYVEILEKKYRAKNVLLAPHGSFQEVPAPSFELVPGPRQIMTFGKFGTYKKVESLIEAFKLLQTTQTNEIELVIAGTDSPNAAGYLEGLRQTNAKTPNIRFTGYVAEEDVARIFGEAAVVVFPYNSTTGSSGVLHQAGDYGKAVVLPHLGDFASLIAEEGYTGEFFEPDNVESLAGAISRLLNDEERRREVGSQNYMASHGLPITEVVDWYLMHFQDITAKRKSSVKRNWFGLMQAR